VRDEPDYLDLTFASLDKPEAVRPSYRIWSTSRISWFDTADDLPRYLGSPKGLSDDEPRRRQPLMDLTNGQASCGLSARGRVELLRDLEHLFRRILGRERRSQSVEVGDPAAVRHTLNHF
jgi:hypothetical protein